MDTRGRRGGHRQFCLPKFAHVGWSRAPEVHQKKPLDVTHFQVEKRSRTTPFRFFQSFALPDENYSTLVNLRETYEGTSCEIGRFVFRNDCHVSIATSLHQSFPWLCPVQAAFTIFQVLTLFSWSKHTHKQTNTHTQTHKQTNTHTQTHTQTQHNTDNRQHKERPRQTHETTQQRNTKHATRITQDKTSQDKSRQDKCIYIHTYAYINTYLYQYLFLYTYIYIHEARPADISGHLSLINYWSAGHTAEKIIIGPADVFRTYLGKLIIGPADQKRTFG